MADEQSPRRRRGWVVAMLVALTASLLSACSDSGNGGDEDDDGPTAPGIEGPAMVGTGYAYALPEGWTDISADALEDDLPKGVDTVCGRGRTFSTSTATVIVERFPVKEGTSPEDVQRSWEENLTKERGLKATYVPSLDVDGEPALGRQIRRKVVGGADDILQVAYLVIHEGYGYSIGLNSAEGDSLAGAAFDGVISSWLWAE